MATKKTTKKVSTTTPEVETKPEPPVLKKENPVSNVDVDTVTLIDTIVEKRFSGDAKLANKSIRNYLKGQYVL